jgi:hypothetical protein
MTKAAGKEPDHLVAATSTADHFSQMTPAQAEVNATSDKEVGRIRQAWAARSAVGTYAFIPPMEIGELAEKEVSNA